MATLKIRLPGVIEGSTVTISSYRITIGRDDTNAVVLPDDTISRRHAVIEHTRLGWILRDLGSTNGTTVHGQPITEHQLRDGDEIGVGDASMVFNEPLDPRNTQPVSWSVPPGVEDLDGPAAPEAEERVTAESAEHAQEARDILSSRSDQEH